MSKLPPLQTGDTIGVMAPSSYVEREDIEEARVVIEARGFKVFVHPQTYERKGQSAGDILQKSMALQGLWQREDISAIWAAGGGNRAMEILGAINFEPIKAKPKPFIGFSDATILLNALYARANIPSIHGPVFKNIHTHNENDIDWILDLLMQKVSKIKLSGYTDVMRQGKAEGVLLGGNLSLFQYAPSLLPALLDEPYILMLEDCNEELSHIDRMLEYLKQSEVLKNAQAIIFGEFINLNDKGRPFGVGIDGIIEEAIEGLDIPIVKNAPFGHGEKFTALPIGQKAALSASNRGSTLRLH